MNNFFNTNSTITKSITLVSDMFLMSLLWLLFSIPIITIGASSVSIYYVGIRKAENKERYLLNDFLTSFKQNFRQATIIWILLIFIYVHFFINVRIINSSLEGSVGIVMMSLTIFVGAIVTFSSIYIFPIVARYKLTIFNIVKLSILLSLKHIFTTLTLILLGLVTLMLMYQIFIFKFIGIGFYVLITSKIFLKIFSK